MSDERLQFLVRLNDALRPLRDPVEMQDVAVRLLGEHLHVNRVSYCEVDRDEFVITRFYVNGVSPILGRGSISAFGAALVDAYRRGETVAVDDVATDPRLEDAERTLLLGIQVAAFSAVTLHKEGRWLASLVVSAATPRAWTRDEIALLEEAGERAFAAAEQARAEEALRQSEARHAFLLMLSDALRSLNDPSDVQGTAARLLGEHLQVNRCGYAEIDDRGYVIRQEFTHGVAPLVGHGMSGTFGAALPARRDRRSRRRGFGSEVHRRRACRDERTTNGGLCWRDADQGWAFSRRLRCQPRDTSSLDAHGDRAGPRCG
jgi:PAS domain-containing protein